MEGDLLHRHRVIHVRGTPASGKIVLSHILFNLLCEQNKDAVPTGIRNVQSDDIRTSSFVFLIDEAQQNLPRPQSMVWARENTHWPG